METVNIEILNPKVRKILKNLAELKLIKINKKGNFLVPFSSFIFTKVMIFFEITNFLLLIKELFKNNN